VASWNPWHGCKKISAGCLNCYVYRIDARHGKDSSVIAKNADFDLPVRKNRKGEYKLQPDAENIVYTCFTSDFFLDEADGWREQAWEMIRLRSDLTFLIITKRIHRFYECIPEDWGDGYDNVIICSTTENQDRADYRLPILLKAPIKHKMIICEPLLTDIDLRAYLCPSIEGVIAGGESGNEARICDYDWVLHIRQQCMDAKIPFHFKQTGANFKKGGKTYRVTKKDQHTQAAKADIDYMY
jgi:protein gp37